MLIARLDDPEAQIRRRRGRNATLRVPFPPLPTPIIPFSVLPPPNGINSVLGAQNSPQAPGRPLRRRQGSRSRDGGTPGGSPSSLPPLPPPLPVFRLYGLPTEIRIAIYRHILTFPHPVRMNRTVVAVQPLSRVPVEALYFLRADAQTYNEAIPIFYGGNSFLAATLPDLEAFRHTIGYRNAVLVRSVTLLGSIINAVTVATPNRAALDLTRAMAPFSNMRNVTFSLPWKPYHSSVYIPALFDLLDSNNNLIVQIRRPYYWRPLGPGTVGAIIAALGREHQIVRDDVITLQRLKIQIRLQRFYLDTAGPALTGAVAALQARSASRPIQNGTESLRVIYNDVQATARRFRSAQRWAPNAKAFIRLVDSMVDDIGRIYRGRS